MVSFLWNLKLQSVDEATQAVQEAVRWLGPAVGGWAPSEPLAVLGDITPEPLGQDLSGLIRVAERSQVLVVTGALPSSASLSEGVDAAKYDLIRRLQFGVPVPGGEEGKRAGTGFIGPVDAGLVSGGGRGGGGQSEVLIASLAGAQTETKAPILLLAQDPWVTAPPCLMEVMEAVFSLVTAGAAPGGVVVGRLPCSLALLPQYRELLKRGVILGLTFFGGIFTPSHATIPPNDEEGAQLVATLCQEGYHDQLLLSHGVSCRAHLKAYGGQGYGHLLRSVIPRLQRHGLSDTHFRAIFHGTVVRLFSWYTPPPAVEKEKEYGTCSWCKERFEMIENEYYHKFSFVYCKSKCLREHAKTGWKPLHDQG